MLDRYDQDVMLDRWRMAPGAGAPAAAAAHVLRFARESGMDELLTPGTEAVVSSAVAGLVGQTGGDASLGFDLDVATDGTDLAVRLGVASGVDGARLAMSIDWAIGRIRVDRDRRTGAVVVLIELPMSTGH